MESNKRNKIIVSALTGVLTTLLIILFALRLPAGPGNNKQPADIPGSSSENTPTPSNSPTNIPSITPDITPDITPSIPPSTTPVPTPDTTPNVTPTAPVTPIPSPTDMVTSIPTSTPAPSADPVVKLHFIDVDQGDSILIEDNGHYMLIDAGVNEQGNIVTKYLKKLGVKKLDYVIGTHPHNDHIGGLDTVINSFKVDHILLPDVSVDSKNYKDMLKAIENRNLKVKNPKVGDRYTLGNSSFVIISPSGSGYESLNDYSIGIKLTYGKNSFLLAGDAQAVSETEMLESGIDLSADLLKLSHHGSSTSSTSSFLDKVDPKYAVISVGAGNKYEHPHSAVMRAMNERNIPLYRTDAQGSIIFTTDGNTISVNVDPYTITISDMTSDAAEEAAIEKGY